MAPASMTMDDMAFAFSTIFSRLANPSTLAALLAIPPTGRAAFRPPLREDPSPTASDILGKTTLPGIHSIDDLETSPVRIGPVSRVSQFGAEQSIASHEYESEFPSLFAANAPRGSTQVVAPGVDSDSGGRRPCCLLVYRTSIWHLDLLLLHQSCHLLLVLRVWLIGRPQM